jgi:hypothetical protein
MEQHGLLQAVELTVLFILRMALTGLHLQMAIQSFQQVQMMLHGRVADGLLLAMEQMFLHIHLMVLHGLQRLQSLVQLDVLWHLVFRSM